MTLSGKFSFRLWTGIPGEKAGKFKNGVPATWIWQGQGLRSRLLPGTILGDTEEFRGLGGEGSGGGAVGTIAGA